MSGVHLIGLGTMGARIAARLVQGDDQVYLSDASLSIALPLADHLGATAVEAGSVTDASIVILMLPNSDIVASVLGDLGQPDSFLRSLAPGTMIIDMGSSRPDATRAVADHALEAGLRFVDAPVSGGPVRAESGELAIMVGIDEESDWERVLPVLSLLGSSVIRTGRVGSAHAVKALNNLLSVIGFVGAIEVLSVGAKFGVDSSTMLDVLNNSTGRNHATEVKIGPQVLDKQWNVGFSLGLTVKDVATALALAANEGLDVPVSAAAVDVARAALEHFGSTPADQSHIAAYLQEQYDVSIESHTPKPIEGRS